jgi:hypothetical protein
MNYLKSRVGLLDLYITRYYISRQRRARDSRSYGFPPLFEFNNHSMVDVSTEGRMQLALDACKKGLYPSKTEISQLRTACQCQKRKREASRHYIATGGSLTGAGGHQRSHDREVQEEERLSRPRRQNRYSNCGQQGHNCFRCPST